MCQGISAANVQEPGRARSVTRSPAELVVPRSYGGAMPSGEHESPIAVAKLDPDLVTWLLAHLFEVKVPDYHHARAHPTDVRVLVPRTYHADGMLLFCDAADELV